MSAPRPHDDPARAQIRERPPIVFVGGTGRSGTHVLAELLDRHRRYVMVPVESRFHVNPQGFPDLLAGDVTPEQFTRKLRRFWWQRIPAGETLPAVAPGLALGRQTRGLFKALPDEQFSAAVERFERRDPHEPLAIACRRLFLDLLWPFVEMGGARGLIEMSTHTVARAPLLAQLFPESKLIHIVRDGRDAGSSKVDKRQRPDHPSDAAEGVDWWLERLERAEAAIAEAPADYTLTLSLDELVAGDREGSYRTLLDFLAIRDAPRMRRFFERHMNPEAASRGRWREGLTEAEQRRVSERYEEALARLATRGYPSAEPLRRVYESLG